MTTFHNYTSNYNNTQFGFNVTDDSSKAISCENEAMKSDNSDRAIIVLISSFCLFVMLVLSFYILRLKKQLKQIKMCNNQLLKELAQIHTEKQKQSMYNQLRPHPAHSSTIIENQLANINDPGNINYSNTNTNINHNRPHQKNNCISDMNVDRYTDHNQKPSFNKHMVMKPNPKSRPPPPAGPPKLKPNKRWMAQEKKKILSTKQATVPKLPKPKSPRRKSKTRGRRSTGGTSTTTSIALGNPASINIVNGSNKNSPAISDVSPDFSEGYNYNHHHNHNHRNSNYNYNHNYNYNFNNNKNNNNNNDNNNMIEMINMPNIDLNKSSYNNNNSNRKCSDSNSIVLSMGSGFRSGYLRSSVSEQSLMIEGLEHEKNSTQIGDHGNDIHGNDIDGNDIDNKKNSKFNNNNNNNKQMKHANINIKSKTILMHKTKQQKQKKPKSIRNEHRNMNNHTVVDIESNNRNQNDCGAQDDFNVINSPISTQVDNILIGSVMSNNLLDAQEIDNVLMNDIIQNVDTKIGGKR